MKIEEEMKRFEDRFYKLIDFVKEAFPGQGFTKKKGAVGISKPYFESIAVGIFLALKEKPNIIAVKKSELEINKNNRNDFFKLIDGRYRTHTAFKIRSRIEYVKNLYLDDCKK